MPMPISLNILRKLDIICFSVIDSRFTKKLDFFYSMYGIKFRQSTCSIDLYGPKALIILLMVFICLGLFSSEIIAANPARFKDPLERKKIVDKLSQESIQRKYSAWEIANTQGWSPKSQIGDKLYELMAIENGIVYVYTTTNVDSAISSGVDLIRNTPPYNLNGSGLTAGVWDGGAVRPTHQEFGGRVTVKDGASNSSHSTHVGGTIGAAGVIASALGMAPSVSIDSYEWTNDTSEMASRGMSYAQEPGTIQVSNHSYSYISGWEHDFSPPRWYGTWGNRESDNFGIYNSYAADWDILCYDAPYFLPFKSAGNDRNLVQGRSLNISTVLFGQQKTMIPLRTLIMMGGTTAAMIRYQWLVTPRTLLL
jgi:hypothetical protein